MLRQEPFSIDTNPQAQTSLACRVIKPVSGFFSSHAIPQATPTLKPSATASLKSSLPEENTHLVQEDAAELSKAPESLSSQTREPSPDPGTVCLKLWQFHRVLLSDEGP